MLFLSTDTIATLGSVSMVPHSAAAHALVSLEAMSGLIGFALLTGLTFARLSRPTARIRFSRFAVVSNRNGVPSLMFRMANEREDYIVEAGLHAVFVSSETTEEGESIRRNYDLELIHNRNPLFALSWTAVHPISEKSPLYGITAESLREHKGVVVVSLTGLDETFRQTVPARHIYKASDIIFGARLADILTPSNDGAAMVVDASRFDDIVGAPIRSGPATVADFERVHRVPSSCARLSAR